MAACVQPVYATPPGFTRHLERAAIHRIIRAGNDWLSARDGNRRIRICGKVVVYKTPGVLNASSLDDGPALVKQFDGLIPARPDQVNMVFYDAPHTVVGGWADMPPSVPGHTALVLLNGFTPPWPDTWWPYWLHETLHAIGIGHVTDDTHDLMSSPRDPGLLHLDPSHSHYWEQLMASPFLTG